MSTPVSNEKENPYSEWFQKIKEVSDLSARAHHKEEPNKEEPEYHQNEPEKGSSFNKLILLAVIALAFVPRIYYIFFISNPQNAGAGWYNDSYHHWQIAYLTKEIGLEKGFLRLWDLSGMEYFWGPLQPLLLSLLFTITGSADILIQRVLNSIAGSISVGLIFLLTKRYFNIQAALAAAFLAMLNPIGIFTDTSGMQEPLAILMMLLGIYFWPKVPLLTAFFWFLASLSRAEYWLFSIGLVAVLSVFDKNREQKLVLLISYPVLIILYLKYLLDKTGNAIYPIYWNFLGNAAGHWQKDIPLTQEQLSIRLIFTILLVISVVLGAFFLLKRPKLYIFSLLGIGNLIFLSYFIGLTQYLKSYIPRFWVDRIFWLPYMWFGFILAVLVLYYIPKYAGKFMSKMPSYVFGWIAILVVAILIQLSWIPINYYVKGYGSGEKYLSENKKIAGRITSHYKIGSILIPGDDPILTYQLHKSGIKGKDIRGQMFDPYFYFAEEEPYAKWNKNRKAVFDFFKKENITLLVFKNGEERYEKLIEREQNSFKLLKDAVDDIYKVYEVKIKK